MSATYEYSPDSDRVMAVSLGPQHPGAGHFRIRLWLDGDYCVRADPDPGYVHRGEEKMCEYKNYIQNIPHLERPSILDSSGILFPYSLAVDTLMHNELPRRAEYLRVISAELDRIISHEYYLGILGLFSGHTTMITWCMGDRDFFIDLADRLTGARVTHAYIIPGGVRNDMPTFLPEKAYETLDWFEKRMDEYEKIFFRNPIWVERSRGVGVLSRDDAVRLGTTGVLLRASGVAHDLRRAEPYSAYRDFDFSVASLKDGDAWSRAYVALMEMRESVKILRQAFKNLPPGPVRLKFGIQPRVPPGEAYARTEGTFGANSFFVVSDGTPKPYRVKIGTGSFRNMRAIPHLLKGVHIGDIPIVYWGIEFWPVLADH